MCLECLFATKYGEIYDGDMNGKLDHKTSERHPKDIKKKNKTPSKSRTSKGPNISRREKIYYMVMNTEYCHPPYPRTVISFGGEDPLKYLAS